MPPSLQSITWKFPRVGSFGQISAFLSRPSFFSFLVFKHDLVSCQTITCFSLCDSCRVFTRSESFWSGNWLLYNCFWILQYDFWIRILFHSHCHYKLVEPDFEVPWWVRNGRIPENRNYHIGTDVLREEFCWLRHVISQGITIN